MKDKNINVNTLKELYHKFNLPIDSSDDEVNFTIHYLENTFKTLPFESDEFRPNYFSFLFIKSAEGFYTIDKKRFEVSFNTVYFTNPGNYRKFEWNKIDSICLITFGEEFLKKFVHDDIYRDFSFLLSEVVTPRVLTVDQFSQIEKLYDYLYKESKRETIYKYKIIGSMIVTLLLKIKEFFFLEYDAINEGSRSSQIVNMFKQNLDSHFNDLIKGKTNTILRVQDYADKQFLHVNYLSSVISSKTGKTISSWIADKIIAEAKTMLQNKSMNIRQISFALGFIEASHFSNYFKKHTSISPSQYRKKYFKLTS